MALIFETEKYRHKENKDIIISLLKIVAEDEDYREPAFFPSEQRGIRSCTGWKVSLNHKFLSDWEEIQDE